MISVQPTLKVQLTGTEVTQYLSESTFTLDTKLEESHKINVVSSAVEINMSNISNPRLLLVSSASTFTLHFEQEITSPLDEVFIYDFTVPCLGGVATVLHIDESFITNLESIKITTDSVNLIKIDVRVYGETVNV